MTTKNENKGRLAPESKHSVEQQLTKTVHLVGAVAAITVWFVAIWLAAVGIGFLVHWTAIHWTWVPGSMISIGHLIEYLVFGADCISLVWSVGLHLYRHCKAELSSTHDQH